MSGAVNLMIHILVDGCNDAVALQEKVRIRNMGRAPAPVASIISLFPADQVNACHLTFCSQKFHR